MKTSRFFINAAPALMDWLIFLAVFAVLYRAGEQRLTLTQCAWLAGISSLGYMLCSLVAGFVVSRRNARLMLIFSTTLSMLGVIVCLLANQFKIMLIGMAMLGIFPASFFNSFQAFIRGESSPGSLTKTIAIYTLSWSLGIGLGFISSGFLYRYGVYTLATLSLAIGLIIIMAVIRHKSRPLEELSSEEHVEEGQAGGRPVNTRYVWVGWVMIFTAAFIQKPLTSFFPAICASEGISSFMASLPLFLVFIVQAFSGLAMTKKRCLLYRRFPFVIAHILAVLLFLAVWMRPTLVVCFLTFSFLGIYFGFTFFCSVYYSSNSGNRVFNVGINEFLVGMASVAGLFISKYWMRLAADSSAMYAVCAAILVISGLLQFLFVSATPRSKIFNQAPRAGQLSPRQSGAATVLALLCFASLR